MLSHYNDYRLAASLDSVVSMRASLSDELVNTQAIQAPNRRKSVDSIAACGVELLFLGGICWVFFNVYNRTELSVSKKITDVPQG